MSICNTKPLGVLSEDSLLKCTVWKLKYSSIFLEPDESCKDKTIVPGQEPGLKSVIRSQPLH